MINTSWRVECILLCIMAVSITTGVRAQDGPDGDNDAETHKGKEILVKEQKVDRKYIRDICKRGKWKYDAVKDRMDGASYTWNVYLPLNNEVAPPGVCVYISPAGGRFSSVGRWKGMMDKSNLIYISSQNSGNNVRTTHRIALTLRAIMIAKEKYQVDLERVYVCGDSGGGRISSIAAALYPEIFAGAIYSIGCDFWKPLKSSKGGYWPGFLTRRVGSSVAPPNLAQLRRNCFVFLTGDKDANMPQTKANYRAYLQSGIRNCAYIQVKNMGHSRPAVDYWRVAFEYLDGKSLKEASKNYEEIMSNAYNEDSGKRLK